jgi:hypothetical protein
MLGYVSMKPIEAFVLLVSLVSIANAKTAHIEGIVQDSSTSLPVSGAEVRISKAGLTAKTNGDGRFTIEVPVSGASDPNYSLVVKEGRYWPKRIEIRSAKQRGIVIELNARKQRLIVTSDIGGSDPDDEQSMVHLLVCASEFDIEGLIPGLAWFDDKNIRKGVLNSIIDEYGKVLPNLRIHADGFPSCEYLRSVVKPGQQHARMVGVGEGKDSPGSELIISAIDKDDPRPVWINAWGGMNTLAQALWQVKNTRSPEAVEKFVRKIRCYDILGQDDAGAWMTKTFPNLFYIRNKQIYGWAPSDEWVMANVQSKGPLGARYPSRIWATEGDSPAFMHVYANGLNNPNEIDQGGWGGRFSCKKQGGIRAMDIAVKSGADESVYDPYEMYASTAEGIAAIKRWENHIYNDLTARMNWTVTGKYAGANHHPIAVVNGDASRQVLEVRASAGATVTLDAAGSSDPDHDRLTYSWYFYKEPSSYAGSVTLQNNSSPSAQVAIPADATGKAIHVILELHDNGTPNLYAYRRVIISVQ